MHMIIYILVSVALLLGGGSVSATNLSLPSPEKTIQLNDKARTEAARTLVAQLGMSGIGPGGFGATSGGFVGPLDVVGGASVFYSLRAAKASLRGQPLANVCNSTGGIDVACADILSDAVTGALVPKTIGAITCPGANCTVQFWYDQSGSNLCTGGVPCHLGNTAVASRPTIIASCLGSQPCIVWPNGGGVVFASLTAPGGSPVSISALSQPLSYTLVANRNTGIAFAPILSWGGTNFFSFRPATNTIGLSLGTTQTATASDATWHAVQVAVDGTTHFPTFTVDATPTTVSSSAGTNSPSGAMGMGNGNNMQMTEVGAYGSVLFSGTQASNMCHNQFSFWGTPTSC